MIEIGIKVFHENTEGDTKTLLHQNNQPSVWGWRVLRGGGGGSGPTRKTPQRQSSDLPLDEAELVLRLWAAVALQALDGGRERGPPSRALELALEHDGAGGPHAERRLVVVHHLAPGRPPPALLLRLPGAPPRRRHRYRYRHRYRVLRRPWVLLGQGMRVLHMLVRTVMVMVMVKVDGVLWHSRRVMVMVKVDGELWHNRRVYVLVWEVMLHHGEPDGVMK